MTNQRAQPVGDNPTVRISVPPQDLDAALESRMPRLEGLLQYLPVREVQIEQVQGFNYPLGGPSDHFDKRILVGWLNGKHDVYAYLEKTTSKVKFKICDDSGREVRLPEIQQLMKRTIRGDAFKFADDAVKLTALALYYFMKLAVVETLDVQDFLSAIKSLEAVAKQYKQRRNGHLLVKLPVKIPADFLREHDSNGAEPLREHPPDRSPLAIRLTQALRPQQPMVTQEPQDERSIISKFIGVENKENDLELEIVQQHLRIAELREQKTEAERERKRLCEEMSKNDAVELGARGGERKRKSTD